MYEVTVPHLLALLDSHVATINFVVLPVLLRGNIVLLDYLQSTLHRLLCQGVAGS